MNFPYTFNTPTEQKAASWFYEGFFFIIHLLFSNKHKSCCMYIYIYIFTVKYIIMSISSCVPFKVLVCFIILIIISNFIFCELFIYLSLSSFYLSSVYTSYYIEPVILWWFVGLVVRACICLFRLKYVDEIQSVDPVERDICWQGSQ